MCSSRGSNRGSVLRLYEPSCPPRHEKPISGPSQCELISLARDLLQRENQRKETSKHASSLAAVEKPVNILNENGYTLRVSSRTGVRKELLKNKHSVTFQDPEEFLRLLDKSAFQCVRDAKLIHPMFLVETKESETNPGPNGLELQLAIKKKNNFTLKYIILEQDMSTMEWVDITDTCTTRNGFCPEISIPVRKSAKIWALHLKRSLCNRIPSLLSLLNGQIRVHIMLYYQVLNKEIKVRIIGISEDPNQTRKRLKTAATAAEEDGFIRGDESAPMLLSRKEGNLNVEFYKDGNSFKSSEFDIEKNDRLYTYGEWHEYTFDVKDLKDNLDVKVVDKNGYVHWSIHLNEILRLEQDGNELQPADDAEQHVQIAWVGSHLNTQCGKAADCGWKLELKRLKSSVDAEDSFNCSTAL